MADPKTTREEDLRRLLTDAIEVQLAALKAGIGFWSEWIEKTSGFVQSASQTLSNIKSDDQAKDVLLELVDAGRESVRSLTDIPRHTATRFLEELDKLDQKKQDDGASASVRRAASKMKAGAAEGGAPATKPGPARPRARRGRVKA